MVKTTDIAVVRSVPRCYGGLVNTLVLNAVLTSRPAACHAEVAPASVDVIGVVGRSGRVLTANERRACTASRGIMPTTPYSSPPSGSYGPHWWDISRGPKWGSSLSELEVAGSNPVVSYKGRSSVCLERQHSKTTH